MLSMYTLLRTFESKRTESRNPEPESKRVEKENVGGIVGSWSKIKMLEMVLGSECKRNSEFSPLLET